jgi:hypothetical protein
VCRSIKPLRSLDPPASDADIQAAARQFVRKVSGFHRPSRANEPAFEAAVIEVARVTESLLAALVTPRSGRPNSANPTDSP